MKKVADKKQKVTDNQSRKWQITINNPIDKGYTHDRLKELFDKFGSLIYWCMADEKGLEDKTHHTHIYLHFSSAVRFSTIDNNFRGGHYEICRGTAQQNRDYVFKEGKWLDDKKRGTNFVDTHEESENDLPIERQGARNDLADLYDMISSGMSNFEIVQSCPDYMFDIDKIERVRQMINEEKYKKSLRFLDVTYVYGKTGAGKTRDIMETHDFNVFRVTDYKHPFDSYRGQDVIVFEEFRSDLKIQEMLNLLDIYPLELPCRYANKIACYTKVYIVTNISLEEQYEGIQKEYPETWKAFLRRIKKVVVYSDNVETYDNCDSYFNRNTRFVSIDNYNQAKLPFK